MALSNLNTRVYNLISKFTACYYLFQFWISLVILSCPTLCDPRDCSMPGLPVHHQLLKSTLTHIH